MAAKLHLAEDALALHLFLERLEGLVDIVVTDKNLHACFLLKSEILLLAARGPGNGRPSRGVGSRSGVKSPSFTRISIAGAKPSVRMRAGCHPGSPAARRAGAVDKFLRCFPAVQCNPSRRRDFAGRA
jgi:hypothetical protein